MSQQKSQPFGIKQIKYIFLEHPKNYRAWADGDHRKDHMTLNSYIFDTAAEMELTDHKNRIGLVVGKCVSFIEAKLPRYQSRVFSEEDIIKNINNFLKNV